jgi:hypothetical protein
VEGAAAGSLLAYTPRPVALGPAARAARAAGALLVTAWVPKSREPSDREGRSDKG